jgi:hypothetical protein
VAFGSVSSAAIVALYVVGEALRARTEVQRRTAERHTAVTDELLARLRSADASVRVEMEHGRFVM